MHWEPLRGRPLDIMPLANSLLRAHCRKMKLTGITIAPDARDALLSHSWPGNVRELDNAIQRALVLHQGNVIHAGDLCLELGMTRATGGEAVAQPAAIAGPASGPFDDSRYANSMPESDLGAPVADDCTASSLGDDLRQQEFRIIIQTLKQERGRRNRAAEQLGISPRTLRYKLAQMRDAGIDLESELATA
jgi:two-component system response regulator FlrC